MIDWTDLLDEDEDDAFREEFQNVITNKDIPKADDSTSEVLDDTYLNMEIPLPRDSEGPEFTKVTKRLRNANGIPIDTTNDNSILDSCVYEVEFADGYKTSLTHCRKFIFPNQ